MQKAQILLIEDDLTFSKILTNFLQKNGYSVDPYPNVKEGMKAFQKNSYQLVLTDFRLPDQTGMDVLATVKQKQPYLPVILMTGFSDIRTAVKAMKMGAYEYIVKPINPDELLLNIEQSLENNTPPSRSQPRAPKASSTSGFSYVKGKSRLAHQIYEQVELVAPTNMSVIVLGESGTGKEYVSRLVHQLSARADKNFVAIDCGALSNDLAASELFGHQKGAFTGALQDKVGHFEEANGGTIFLDEVGNLSYEVQVKLLRAIQERKIKRLGSNQDIDIDVRIITATNDDLMQSVKKGSFREDLYHRLNEFSIKIPPLRDRKEDIALYSRYFREKSNDELNKEVEDFDAEVSKIFEDYYWPGNLRELKNIVKRSVLLAKRPIIEINCLPAELIAEVKSHNRGPQHRPTNDSDLKRINEETEKELIIKTLVEVRYNKSKAAKLLNIDRKTLYNKIEKYNIQA